jgi:hypothetical protein
LPLVALQQVHRDPNSQQAGHPISSTQWQLLSSGSTSLCIAVSSDDISHRVSAQKHHPLVPRLYSSDQRHQHTPPWLNSLIRKCNSTNLRSYRPSCVIHGCASRRNDVPLQRCCSEWRRWLALWFAPLHPHGAGPSVNGCCVLWQAVPEKYSKWENNCTRKIQAVPGPLSRNRTAWIKV